MIITKNAIAGANNTINEGNASFTLFKQCLNIYLSVCILGKLLHQYLIRNIVESKTYNIQIKAMPKMQNDIVIIESTRALVGQSIEKFVVNLMTPKEIENPNPNIKLNMKPIRG